ncbi:MAG: glycosyltransferase family 2 protein [Bacilli bacterium]
MEIDLIMTASTYQNRMGIDVVCLSVVIPAYNESDNVERIIGYLREQKFDDFEIVFVVDGKTTDDTLELISRFSEGLNCKSIIQTGDGRLGEARNIGLENSSGKYVWFLDADDRPYPEFVSTMVELADKYKAEIVQCNFIRSFDIDTPEPKGNFKVRVLSNKEALIERSLEQIPVTAWSMVHRRDFLMDNDLRFHHGGYAEDVNHTYRAMEMCDTLVYYDRPMYLYYQNPLSICSSRPNDVGNWEVRVYGELEEHFRKSWFGEIFSRRSAIMRVRSAGHMDRNHFIKYIKSDECKEMRNKHMRDPLSWDHLWVSLSPSTYHLALNMYLKFVYYRDNRLFDTRVRKI